MSQRSSVLGGALRLLAVGLSGVAVLVVLQHGRAERRVAPVEDDVRSPDEPSAVAIVSSPAPRQWSLRTGGWYIRVDGAEVAIPSVEEQTRGRPRASLASGISPYDQLIAHHAKAEGFDWRLIAALIFEESRFDPTSRSDKGAYGLMQVRPIAAEAVGAERFQAPADNVQTGVRYLRQLDAMFAEARGRERLALVLAAYNVGPGHVRDAQALARRFGYDPDRFEDAVELMLPLLEVPAIYRDLPNSFAKGSDTVAYVHRILDRFHQYQRQTADAPLDDDALSSTASRDANG
jgi:soluble lytic murein transglycosylase-like protein